jgi:hypothetical protein
VALLEEGRLLAIRKTAEMQRDEQLLKAFDFASDTTKQMIALTSAVIALTVTFGKDIFVTVPFYAKITLTAAWLVYIFSLLCGIFALLGLTAWISPDEPPDPTSPPSSPIDDDYAASPPSSPVDGYAASPPAAGEPSLTIYGNNVRNLSGAQIISFLAATFLVTASGLILAWTQVSDYWRVGSAREHGPRITVALLRGSESELARLLAEDGVFVTPRGETFDKAAVLAAVRSGALILEDIKTDQASVSNFDGTPVETGYAKLRGKYQNQEFSGQFRYVAVLDSRAWKWQVVNFRLTRAAQ